MLKELLAEEREIELRPIPPVSFEAQYRLGKCIVTPVKNRDELIMRYAMIAAETDKVMQEALKEANESWLQDKGVYIEDDAHLKARTDVLPKVTIKKIKKSWDGQE